MERKLETTVKPEDKMNDVLSKDFVSKIDKYFLRKAGKDHLQRRGSTKIYGQWT